MTETEWLNCIDSMRMLRSIRDKVTPRKEALFTSACCYRLWEWLSDTCRQQVRAIERHADDPELPDVGAEEFEGAFYASQAAAPEAVKEAFEAVILAGCGYWQVEAVEETEREALANAAWLNELKGQAHLVRDLFGNPFRRVTADPAWLTPTVVELARTIYEEGAFDRLPILADALEESGCSDQDILGHCRGAGPHVRGCWVLDLILGKE